MQVSKLRLNDYNLLKQISAFVPVTQEEIPQTLWPYVHVTCTGTAITTEAGERELRKSPPPAHIVRDGMGVGADVRTPNAYTVAYHSCVGECK